MALRKGRFAAGLCLVVAVALLAFFAIVYTDQAREIWILQEFDSYDLDEKKAALETLGRIGGDRAVAKLLDLVRLEVVRQDVVPEDAVIHLALEALEDAFGRLSPSKQDLVVEALFQGVRTKTNLVRIGKENIGLLPKFFEALASTPSSDRSETASFVTILPRWIYEAVLPLRIFPVPDSTVRVGLVWRECESLRIASDIWKRPVSPGHRSRPARNAPAPVPPMSRR